MKELQRKQGIRRVIYSIPSLIVLSAVSFFLAKGALGVMKKEWASSERSRDLEEKVAALALRELELKEEVLRLQTEEGIKSEIKEKFSVIQAGEHVAVIVDDRGASSSTDSSTLPWYKKLWLAIIGDK